MNIDSTKFVDFHTHLDFYAEEELFNQLLSFNGVIVAASVNQISFNKIQSIANKANQMGCKGLIIPTLGIHPMKANEEIDYLAYENLLENSKIIGEIGMDFCWYKDAKPEQQEEVFRFFLNHCNQKQKYCVIHTKDAEQRIADILLDYPNAKPIIHWYDGPENIYKTFINRGYMQTFGCETIRSSHIQKLLKITPPELILAETDNPDSEPWLGGTDNSIFLIERIYKDISEILGMPPKATMELINSNASRILNSIL